jgi:lipoprotein-anchoring transpeptidase ErfK/SrfK
MSSNSSDSLHTARMLTAPVRSAVAMLGMVFLLMVAIWWIDRLPALAEPGRGTPLSIASPSATSPTAARLAVAVAIPSPTTVPLTPTTPGPIRLRPTPTPAAATLAPPMIVAGANGVNVRSGPGTGYARIGSLDPGTQAQMLGRYGDWWQIEYDGGPAWVAGWVVTAYNADDVPQVELLPAPSSLPPTPIPPSATPGDVDEERWIDVDLSQQLMTAYEGHTPVRNVSVSSGLPATPTPAGQFRIWVKFRYDDMEGPGYYLADVPYVMYFYKGYGLHGTYWHANFGHPMSHGCVNLPTPEAEWLFNWADVGTLVNIHN